MISRHVYVDVLSEKNFINTLDFLSIVSAAAAAAQHIDIERFFFYPILDDQQRSSEKKFKEFS